MTVFFTADTHFGHANIIRYCNRPFADVHQMDACLIERWNAVVSPSDTVWHLGDFTLGDNRAALNYRSRLNGDIHLIWGNHDRSAVRSSGLWASSSPVQELTLDGHHIVLCHYAMQVWNRSHHGALHLFGHSHGALSNPSPRSLDVGVDCHDFRPVTLTEILARLPG